MKFIQYREETLFPREDVTMTQQIIVTQRQLLAEVKSIMEGISKKKRVLIRLTDQEYPDGRVKVGMHVSEYWFDRWDVVWLLVLIVLAVMFHFLQS